LLTLQCPCTETFWPKIKSGPGFFSKNSIIISSSDKSSLCGKPESESRLLKVHSKFILFPLAKKVSGSCGYWVEGREELWDVLCLDPLFFQDSWE
jgi:hypothetical protein